MKPTVFSRTVSLLLILLLAAALLPSCTIAGKTMDGDKNVLERTFKLEEAGVWTLKISGLRLSSGCAVSPALRTGPVYGEALKIATDDNVFTSLTVDVDREQMVITVTGKDGTIYDPSEFTITCGAALRKVELDGGWDLGLMVSGTDDFTLDLDGSASGSLITDRLQELTVALDGAADLTLEGSVSTLMLEADGAAQISAKGLTAETANVSLEGAASAVLNVTGELYLDAAGTSAVTCYGNPTVKKQQLAGLSELTMADGE